MKKFIIFGFVAVMVFLNFLIVYASKSDTAKVTDNDSLNISNEERRLLNVEASDNVIKVYNLAIYDAFSTVNSIEELFEKELIFSEYYAVQKKDNTIVYRDVVNNEAVELNGVILNQKTINRLFDNEIISRISSDIEVYGIYYLSGETSYTGSAIYYQTNKGDYVYYDHYSLKSGEYLFPIKDFCELQKAIIYDLSLHPDLDDGGVDISRLYEVSKYDIHSSSFDIAPYVPDDQTNKQILIVAIIGVSLISIGGAIMYLFVFKRKKCVE